jgi:hypothetical protein
MSHPIRGTNNDFDGNCKKAVAAAKRLRNVFPEVDFYVPAEHDLVVQWLYFNKKVSEKNVLDADLHILRHCHGWFFYKFDESSGGNIEEKEAIKLGYCPNPHSSIGYQTIFTFQIEKANYDYLRKAFGPVVEAAKKRFREKK